MKKILIITTLIMLFTVSCGSAVEKKIFMEACNDGSLGEAGAAYCECAWSEYEIHGDTEAYITALENNCLSLLLELPPN